MWTMVEESHEACPEIRCSDVLTHKRKRQTCLNYASGSYSGRLNVDATSCYSVKLPGRVPVQSSLPIELKAWASFKRTTLSVAAK